MELEKLNKKQLIEKVAEYEAKGVKWIAPETPDEMNKADLIQWLTYKEPEFEAGPIEIKSEAEGTVILESLKEGEIRQVQPSPMMTNGPRENHSPEAVKRAARKQFYHGIEVLTVQDQLIGHRIYKDIKLMNGTGYKLTLEEFALDITYKDHE